MEGWRAQDRASYCAANAIRLDSQDSKSAAIKHYRLAIDALLILMQRYPDYKLHKVYMERANAYERRIMALKSSIPDK
jgi:hypothetical protein